MFRDMPRSKEKVVYCQNPVETAPIFTDWLKAGTWFEFPEVHIEIPKLLWMKFEEMAPLFFAIQIPDEAVLYLNILVRHQSLLV